MQLSQQLAVCKTCEKRKFDPNQGILCSLTERKPSFENSCINFILDPKQQAKVAAKTYKTESESKSSASTWTIIVVIFVIVRIILRIMRN